MTRIESPLSARQFLVPELAGEHIYFVSNLSGRLSLYRMKRGGTAHFIRDNSHLISFTTLFEDAGGLGWMDLSDPAEIHTARITDTRHICPKKHSASKGPRPLVYYIHGGPQGQERPDFTWFSMPLIQFLTLRGFAVFVPNVRGSTGYGLSYTKMVDRDWSGRDRLDHVHAMTQVLPRDPRIDVGRAGVVGRSYGGYMTLTLAARHPELWKASCDMFGPYDLFTFLARLPETWRPYFHLSLGHPETDRDFLIERSPKTYVDQIAAPMLVIQGKNDPRVIEQESHDLVDRLNGMGKQVTYLMFEDEGHDMIKFENKVRCYNAITDFFVEHLRP